MFIHLLDNVYFKLILQMAHLFNVQSLILRHPVITTNSNPNPRLTGICTSAHGKALLITATLSWSLTIAGHRADPLCLITHSTSDLRSFTPITRSECDLTEAAVSSDVGDTFGAVPVDTAVSGSKLALFCISPKGECRCHLGSCSEMLLDRVFNSQTCITQADLKTVLEAWQPLEP